MNHRIIGTTLPVLEMELQPGESIEAVSGELSWMSQSINMHTTTAMGGGGGIFGVIKRVAGGGSLFMTEYTAQGAPGIVAFATRVPGHILPVDVSPGRTFLIHRHGFLCATPGVELECRFPAVARGGHLRGRRFSAAKARRNVPGFRGTRRRGGALRPRTR